MLFPNHSNQWRMQKSLKGWGLQVENTIIESGLGHKPKTFPN